MPADKKDEPAQCNSGKLSDVAFKIETSDYYKLHLLEHQAIIDNQYFLSQKLGVAVTYQDAFWNFNFCHRDKWIKNIRASGLI